MSSRARRCRAARARRPRSHSGSPAIRPVLITSANPARSSSSGSVASQGGIGEHRDRLVERADVVLAFRQVDARLAAVGGVDLRRRAWSAPARPRRRAGRSPRRSPARSPTTPPPNATSVSRALHPGRGQRAQHALGLGKGLVALARRDEHRLARPRRSRRARPRACPPWSACAISSATTKQRPGPRPQRARRRAARPGPTHDRDGPARRRPTASAPSAGPPGASSAARAASRALAPRAPRRPGRSRARPTRTAAGVARAGSRTRRGRAPAAASEPPARVPRRLVVDVQVARRRGRRAPSATAGRCTAPPPSATTAARLVGEQLQHDLLLAARGTPPRPRGRRSRRSARPGAARSRRPHPANATPSAGGALARGGRLAGAHEADHHELRRPRAARRVRAARSRSVAPSDPLAVVRAAPPARPPSRRRRTSRGRRAPARAPPSPRPPPRPPAPCRSRCARAAPGPAPWSRCPPSAAAS